MILIYLALFTVSFFGLVLVVIATPRKELPWMSFCRLISVSRSLASSLTSSSVSGRCWFCHDQQCGSRPGHRRGDAHSGGLGRRVEPAHGADS